MLLIYSMLDIHQPSKLNAYVFPKIWVVNSGKTVLAQVLAGLGGKEFSRCAGQYPLSRDTPALSAYDHFATMVFAQLTYRESLRDIEACLTARRPLLYHSGIRGTVKRCNLAYANEHRDWRMFAAVAGVLMRRARRLYQDEPAPLELDAELFALDATLIELSCALFPWARWQGTQAAMKLNVLLDLRGDVPAFASIHEGDRHEVASLDEIPVYPGAYYVMDRGYLDFGRLHRLHTSGAFFVTRLKANTCYYVAESRPVPEHGGLRCDQTIRLNSDLGRNRYPDTLRRISYLEPETHVWLVFLTNQFALDARTITQIYKHRWKIELFFRWIKQHLRLRGFFSTDPNGVRVQIWTALCAYLLVAIAKREYALPGSLHQVLQVISIAALEKVPLPEIFAKIDTTNTPLDIPIQLEMNGF
ncbi:IS4 family transposase [Opitutus sp. ER46]|nr:IS4 family transposase [Opitutus sp. ER46]